MDTTTKERAGKVLSNTAFLKELKEKLPEFFTNEGAFDLNKFKNQLQDENIKETIQGCQLMFVGKDYARKQAGEKAVSTVIPDQKQNKGEGAHSQNLFFTGDNLEVLKHLQNKYCEKVDLIYIDPPYNTGKNEFIYPDQFDYTDSQLKKMFNLDEDQLHSLKSIQGSSSHSAWLTFMYPRLQLARNLLKQTGVIFISIGDTEDGNLREICDEIFGESNFLAQVVWERAYAPVNLRKNFSNSHEYLLVYGKDASEVSTNGLPRTDKADSTYSNPDNDPRGPWRSNNMAVGPAVVDNIYPITIPSGRVVHPPAGRSWLYSKENYQKKLADHRIWFGKNGNSIPRAKTYKSELKKTGMTPMTLWKYQEVGHSHSATIYLQELMGGKKYFPYPKPVKLIQRVVQLYADKNATVLDFFAGSATTAEAVMQQNIEDQGHRKFIMVQLPEKTYYLNKQGEKVPTNGGRDAFNDGYMSIDEIAQERIRRAAKKIKEENKTTLPKDFDGSFKHYWVVKSSK